MSEIVITVRNKIATASVRQIVCDNTDYTVRLDLDADWTAGAKTVLFVLQGVGVLAPGVTTDDTCAVPAIRLSDGVGRQLAVGVQQGAVKTTTAASIWCYPSAESAMLTAIVEDESVSKTWLEWVNENMAQAEINVETAERVLEEAQGAADDAADAASDAESARDDAIEAKNAAVAAQAGAEAARSEAETAETGAVTAQTGAEAARAGAETAQAAAESARDTAVAAKNDATSAKTAAQTAKSGAVTAKNAAVTAQESAEEAMTQAQTARTEAETAQAAAVAAKSAAETARTGAESAMTNASGSAQSAAASASAASSSETAAEGYATSAEADASDAASSASAASSSATAAASSASAAASSETAAASSAAAAQAWATGGSSGTPSATNNAEYWAGEAEDAAESVSASAAQIAQNAGDIADLKTQLNVLSVSNNSDINRAIPELYLSGVDLTGINQLAINKSTGGYTFYFKTNGTNQFTMLFPLTGNIRVSVDETSQRFGIAVFADDFDNLIPESTVDCVFNTEKVYVMSANPYISETIFAKNEVFVPAYTRTTSKRISTSGDIVDAGSGWFYSSPIQVKNGDVIKLRCGGNSNAAPLSITDETGSEYTPCLVYSGTDPDNYTYTCEEDGYLCVSLNTGYAYYIYIVRNAFTPGGDFTGWRRRNCCTGEHNYTRK